MKVVDTAKVILLPAPFYERGLEEDYLRFGGVGVEAGEMIVVSALHEIAGVDGGVVAVMAAPASEGGSGGGSGVVCGSGFGCEGEVTSPLFRAIEGFHRKRSKREVNILLTEANIYIAVWDKGLRFAEAFPEREPDSVLYYMSALGQRFELRRFDISVGGVSAGDIATVLRPYWGQVSFFE